MAGRRQEVTSAQSSEPGARDRRRTPVALRLATLIPALFVAVLFVWPIVALVRRAGEVGGGSGVGDRLADVDGWHLLGVTLLQAAASSALSLLVAAPIVWLLATVRLRGAAVLRVIVTVPFVLPTVVVGVAFRALLTGPLDFLGVDGGWVAILMAHVFLNVAVVVRVVTAAWLQVDPRTVEAARSLGATPLRAFWDVVVPRIAPAIAAAAALILLFCSTSFGVIVILGNGTARTLETEIYQQAIAEFRIPEAVALSMLQIAVVAGALVVARLVGSRGTVSGVSAAGREGRRPVRGWLWAPVAATLAWLGLWLLLPVASLAVRSVRPDGREWTLAGYRALADTTYGDSALGALRYSVTSALAAMVLAVVIGFLVAVSVTRGGGWAAQVTALLAVLPLGVSAVTLGFGYLLVVSTLPPELSQSPLVIPSVQALLAVPVVAGIMIPALAQVPRGLRDAARVLGARPLWVLISVDVRLTVRSLCAAAGFAFVMAIGEFGATTFLARPDTTTLPVMIGSLMAKPGLDNLATAMAASVVLVTVSAAVIAAIEILGVGGTDSTRSASSTKETV
ncbi:iron ABC transporter permease [Gordonia phthalatica]|uniref:Iron ABC transporter permease n=1 Tax=Gordonia phthalatica TaxID=1136941 RepID=A0A0N9N9Y9_9ACTN|nr:iron ABC transporter permease [Gordonia phthalatica]